MYPQNMALYIVQYLQLRYLAIEHMGEAWKRSTCLLNIQVIRHWLVHFHFSIVWLRAIAEATLSSQISVINATCYRFVHATYQLKSYQIGPLARITLRYVPCIHHLLSDHPRSHQSAEFGQTNQREEKYHVCTNIWHSCHLIISLFAYWGVPLRVEFGSYTWILICSSFDGFTTRWDP